MRIALPLVLASLACSPRPAHADPEWNLSARGSLCRLDTSNSDARLAFCAELEGDVLFGRARDDSFGWGPFISIGSARFADLRPSAGLSLLVPLPSGDFPIVVSAGALSRNFNDVRASANVFWGLRSHNFHGNYAMASGLVLGGDRGFDAARPTTLYAGLQLDGLWLALPFILGYEWLRGSPSE